MMPFCGLNGVERMAEVLVLGAGMVGIGTALALQARGHAVTLVDRREPGRETSYGNAGLIQREAVEPYAIPRELPTLWRYLTGQSNDVTYHLRDVFRFAPALWSYFRASATPRHRAIARTYAQLIARSTDDHAPLIAAADAEGLIRRAGFYQVYREARAFDGATREAERLRQTYGVASRLLDGAALMVEEPALRKSLAGAVHWTDSWSTNDPAALVEAYVRLFQARGGRLVTGDAAGLERQGNVWRVPGDGGAFEAAAAVVALGPWSPDLLARFGYRVPMVWKRGYHRHFEHPTPLNRPLMDVANGVVLSSMQQGLRMTTGAEIVARGGSINPRQLERGRAAAREILELGEPVEAQPWFGHRPCMPDMLPVVGAAPLHPGLWFNFGHGHQGLTLGPTTGELLAELFDGEDSALAQALSPARRLPAAA